MSKVPIVFISSRNSNIDIIMAINMGGDDFLQKPFSMDVAMAKINGIMRRTYSYSTIKTEVLEYKGVLLNLANNSVMYNENKAELTKNEFGILHSLMKENGKIVSRDKLMRYPRSIMKIYQELISFMMIKRNSQILLIFGFMK